MGWLLSRPFVDFMQNKKVGEDDPVDCGIKKFLYTISNEMQVIFLKSYEYWIVIKTSYLIYNEK